MKITQLFYSFLANHFVILASFQWCRTLIFNPDASCFQVHRLPLKFHFSQHALHSYLVSMKWPNNVELILHFRNNAVSQHCWKLFYQTFFLKRNYIFQTCVVYCFIFLKWHSIVLFYNDQGVKDNFVLLRPSCQRSSYQYICAI